MSSRPILIKSRGVYDDAHGRVLADHAVLVRNDTIEAVDRWADLQDTTERAEVVDLSDRYIFPGLINTHVHLTFSAAEDPLKDYLAENIVVRTARAIKNAQTLLQSGVTTVRDCGSDWELLSLPAAVQAGLVQGPKLVLCGPPITPTGGHLHFMHGEADTVDEIRHGIQERAARGASSIKLMASGGQMTPGTVPEEASYSLEQLTAAVVEADSFGLPTVAHCLATEGIGLAAEAGAGSIEHCAFFVRQSDGWLERRYDPDIARKIRPERTVVMMGLAAGYRGRDISRREGPRTKQQAFLLEQEARMLNIFHHCVELGVGVVTGTDAGVAFTPFDETYLELELMSSTGLSSIETIRAATTRAAETLGLGDRVGRIAPGYTADLIALKVNPLEDVRAFRSVSWVMSRGVVVTHHDQEE